MEYRDLQSFQLTEKEQKRFDSLPKITMEQQKVIDSFAFLMIESIREQPNEKR